MEHTCIFPITEISFASFWDASRRLIIRKIENFRKHIITNNKFIFIMGTSLAVSGILHSISL